MADQSSKAPTQSPDAAKAQEKTRRPEPPVQEQAQGLGSEAVALGPLLGSSVMDLPVERHAALLGDPRISHPSNTLQRAQVMKELQQRYGNAHVQRVMYQVQKAEGETPEAGVGITKAEGETPKTGSETPKEEAEKTECTKYSIVYGSGWKESAESVTVKATLKEKFLALCDKLIEDCMVTGNITIKQGIRTKKTAHKWHTAKMIRDGKVALQKLKDLEGGKDEDGNIWWKAEWDGLPDAQALTKAKAHAKTLWSGAYAAEGYPAGDSKRLPCNCSKGRSNHLFGNAIDAKIPWTGGAWSTDAKTRVDNAGLKRPVSSESWHFELK